ncbi:hypothetical protein PJV92_11495 [Aliarcobacter butzleri]|uniref:Uncharacterized protein n=2 Tax=root TaxID=1 RepID=A0AAP4Q0F1_9BACT|nr:hypothetical protein [Aliarcobacter butzleri]MCG3663223.1 hypothetical protein [Aliarcobacter butzleri]MCT7536560.1 hypothetical protein [Aliarcobacter butzleri]MCT7623244.1 hypothetical protein [Aliarcobacter butzleri]MDN5051375.1 hypothetical protein [Aliarcobacter butzleri]MDN5074194.1 hypothetical protein [Aliarcobacter butzleri]
MDKIKLKRKIFKLSNFITFKRKMYFLILYMILEPISLIFFGALYFNNFNLNETFLKLATYSNDVIDAYIIIALFFGSFKFIFIDYWNK